MTTPRKSFARCILTLLPALVSITAAAQAQEPLAGASRKALAERFSVYDFEPRGNDPRSRDRDGDRRPDFWEVLVDQIHPHYHRNNVAIVTDPADAPRPGLGGQVPGYVLKVPFDGAPVAVQTRFPKIVDPDRAYEITVWARTRRLEHSIVQFTLVWLRYDEIRGEKEISRNFLRIPPGQRDWPEAPLRLRVNDIPAEANRVRVICEILDDPDFPGADRDGVAWFDDIRIQSRPKIRLKPKFINRDDPQPLSFKILYLGLLPKEELRSGKPTERRYIRTIEIKDIYGDPPKTDDGRRSLPLRFSPAQQIRTGIRTTHEEEISLDLERLGVHYVTVRLFNLENEKLAEITQVIGRWKPALKRDPGKRDAEDAKGFGIVLDEPPAALLSKRGTLADIVQRSGASFVKINLWPRQLSLDESKSYFVDLAQELRMMRGSGIRVTGNLVEHSVFSLHEGMHQAMRAPPPAFENFLQQAAEKFDMYIDTWQLGDEDDASFSHGVEPKEVETVRKMLNSVSSSPLHVYPVQLSALRAKAPPAELAYALTFRVPYTMSYLKMTEAMVHFAPDGYMEFRRQKRHLYPPEFLLALAPRPRTVDEEAVEAELESYRPWLSIELTPANIQQFDLKEERAMIEDMVKKAVLGRAVDIDRVYLGSLKGGRQSLITFTREDKPIPRPSFFAARVLQDYLGGAKYLGSFVLHNEFGDFPNFVFQRYESNDTAVVVWYEGKGESAEIDYGGGNNLRLVDMMGNVTPVPKNSRFIARRVPQIVIGMDQRLARTRMSLRIRDNPPMSMRSEDQYQEVVLTNFFDGDLAGDVELRYARAADFSQEIGWRVRPIRQEFKIARPKGHGEDREYYTETLRFEVRPPDNTPADGEGAMGRKYVIGDLELKGEQANLRIVRETPMESDIKVEIQPVQRNDNPNNDVLLMKIRWAPSDEEAALGELTVQPFFITAGSMEVPLARKSIPAYARTDTQTPPETIEFLVPRSPIVQRTWIGLRQEGGSRFFVKEVTGLLRPYSR